MKCLLSSVLTFFSIFAFGQSANVLPTPDTTEVYMIVELMPMYPGGEEAMAKFIKKNIKYPDQEKKNGVEGRVVLGIQVERDGSLTNINIRKGVSPGIDKEALRLVSLFPKFNPGKHRGQTVRVKYALSIVFKL